MNKIKQVTIHTLTAKDLTIMANAPELHARYPELDKILLANAHIRSTLVKCLSKFSALHTVMLTNQHFENSTEYDMSDSKVQYSTTRSSLSMVTK